MQLPGLFSTKLPLCPSSACALQAIQNSAPNEKALGFLHVGSLLSTMIHTELNIQGEQRANALLILFPCQSPVGLEYSAV